MTSTFFTSADRAADHRRI